MAKSYKVGSLLKNEKEMDVNGQKVKRSWLSIGLGQRNAKKPEWDQTVEIIVRNSKGEILARQTDGWLDVVNPRDEPKELLAAGAIDEAQAQKMTENLKKLPDKVKYVLKMRASN